MNHQLLFLLCAAAATAPLAASAQGRGHDKIPPGQMPPAGSCRIWFDGLPPGHEPLPTDCQTAFRDAPSDARVLVGAGVDAGDYGQEKKHDHGEHRGWDKGHGNKHHDDGDGRDDRDAASECLAYDRDGGCANVYAPAGGPPVMPDMVGAVFASEGRAWPEVQRWIGNLAVTVHVDLGVGGRPSRVRWTDREGHLVQEWVDANGDGRATVVHVYRQGVLVRSYGQ